jgi:RHS repeat-associated protein
MSAISVSVAGRWPRSRALAAPGSITARATRHPYAYDGRDRLTLATAPEGGTSGYTYSADFNNNVTQVTRTPKPDSPLAPLTTTFSYDSIYNKPTQIVDPLGLVTSMSYDGATGNLTTTTSDVGGSPHFNAQRSFAYNSVGQVLTTTDPLGTVTQFGYDSFGNQTSITRDIGAGRLNQLTTIGYNAVGDPISITDPRANPTTSIYDAARRLTATTAPNRLMTAYSYDPDGRVTQAQQSASGTVLRSTGATYTLTGKPATATDANNNTTSFTYDLLDRVSSVKDAMGRTTSYGYDALSRQIAISNFAVQGSPLLQQAYTPDGLLASLTDANNHATSFAYDGFDRLATTTYPLGSTETLTYDADGNVLTRKTRANQTVSFAYDTLNRLITKTPPSPAPVVSYRYDLAGRLTGVSDTSAAIAAAVPPSGPSVQYATTAAYDALNRPTGISWTPAPTAAAPTASSVTFGHAYNKANQRIGQTATDNSWLNYPAATPSTVSYAADALNRYTAVGGVTPTYDGNSNLTFDGTFTFGYDAENRLTSAVGAGNTAAYTYDAQGRRKTRTVNSTTTVFVTDAANHEVLEYDGTSGAILRWYAYGLGSNDVLNQMNVATATRATFIPDIQGSVIASLDSSSGVLSKIGYLPYGKSASASGPFGYTGQRIDPETSGLYYYRARHYMLTWGRFLQPDAIGYSSGVNLYAYVGNDPLNLIDPWGLETQYSFGIGGTLAFYVLGIGGNASLGISVPDRWSNLGGYQIFLTVQGNGMGGGGAYAGYGVSASRGTSSGPLSIVSGSTGWYAGGDIGYGVSFSASIQGDRNGVSGVSVNPRPTVGVGYGVWAGFGGNGNVTLATPTFGQIYNSLASTFSTSSQPSATSGDNSAIAPVSTATVSTQNDAGGNIGLAGDSVGSAPNGSSPGK